MSTVTTTTQPDKPTPPVVNVWLSVVMEIAAARAEAQKGGTK